MSCMLQMKVQRANVLMNDDEHVFSCLPEDFIFRCSSRTKVPVSSDLLQSDNANLGAAPGALNT